MMLGQVNKLLSEISPTSTPSPVPTPFSPSPIPAHILPTPKPMPTPIPSTLPPILPSPPIPFAPPPISLTFDPPPFASPPSSDPFTPQPIPYQFASPTLFAPPLYHFHLPGDTLNHGYLNVSITKVFDRLRNVLVLVVKAKGRNNLVETKGGKNFNKLDLLIDLTTELDAYTSELDDEFGNEEREEME